jgi:hypothetical protein
MIISWISAREAWHAQDGAHPYCRPEGAGTAEHRTTWDDGYGPDFHGYVAHTDSMKAEIILTGRVGVVHTHCMIQSSDLLHCEHRYGNGGVSNMFVLTRIGPGPKTLLPVQS